MNKAKRLIDSDALEADLKRQYDQVFGTARRSVSPDDFYIDRCSAFYANVVEAELNGFFKYLKTRPTVDAVPVVRCKDCRYWTQDGNGYFEDQAHCGNPYGIDGYTDSGDFCSCGERRCDNG